MIFQQLPGNATMNRLIHLSLLLLLALSLSSCEILRNQNFAKLIPPVPELTSTLAKLEKPCQPTKRKPCPKPAAAVATSQPCALSAMSAFIPALPVIGQIDACQTIASAGKVFDSVLEAFKDKTPAEEYYLGRFVGAELLSKYPVKALPKENHYLNLIGKTLVLNSEQSATYPNYHFLILDTEKINAFAAPTGFIFISKGMIRLCQNEDDLAAVLAHEISHVLHQDALSSIDTSNITSVFTTIGTEGLKITTQNQQILNQLVTSLEGDVDKMTQKLVNSPYTRSTESAADETAVELLQNSGYNAEGLLRVLKQLKAKSGSTKGDFFATHPDTDDRIKDVEGWLSGKTVNPVSAKRTQRFTQNIGRL